MARIKQFSDGIQCVPCVPSYPEGLIKNMPIIIYTYWRKEVHISIPLVTVMRDISNKLINRLKEVETCAESNTVKNGKE